MKKKKKKEIILPLRLIVCMYNSYLSYLLAVYDEYTRHEEMAIFCVTTSTSSSFYFCDTT